MLTALALSLLLATARPRIVIPQPDTVQLLRESCWICGANRERIDHIIERVLERPHLVPVWLYIAAQNQASYRETFRVMEAQHFCEPRIGGWDLFITHRQAKQIRRELDLLLAAEPWVEALP